jgi:hypothetical protein
LPYAHIHGLFLAIAYTILPSHTFRIAGYISQSGAAPYSDRELNLQLYRPPLNFEEEVKYKVGLYRKYSYREINLSKKFASLKNMYAIVILCMQSPEKGHGCGHTAITRVHNTAKREIETETKKDI